MESETEAFELRFPVMVVAVFARPDAAAVVRDLFVDVVAPTETERPDLTVCIGGEADSFSLSGVGHGHQNGLSMRTMLDRLIAGINRAAVDHADNRLSLHAAVLEREGEALMVLGDTGTGKTTMALALARRSWRYMSDEIAWVAPGAETITALHKPFTIKPGTNALVGDFDGPEPEPARRYVRADTVGTTADGAVAPRSVVVLRSDASGDATATSGRVALGPADAVMAIVEHAFDMERLGPDAGLYIAADLAAACPVIEVGAGTVEERATAVDTAWNAALPKWSSRPLVPPEPHPDGVGPRWAPGVSGVEIGGCAILCTKGSQRFVRIDPMPLGFWEALDGTRDPDATISAVAAATGLAAAHIGNDIAALVDSLLTEGVVVGDTA